MKDAKEAFLTASLLVAPPALWDEYSSAYDEMLTEAVQANPLPDSDRSKTGRPKRGKVRALIDRLLMRKAEYLLFFTDFSVPLDNNQAERDFRMFKVKQKVSGCFRSIQGAHDFAAVFSFLSTDRKRGFSAFLAIKSALLGDPASVLHLLTD